jgi:H+-transporting ATPase
MASTGIQFANGAHDKDVERGNSHAETARFKSFSDPKVLQDLDEYTALQRYITGYRDPRAAVLEGDDDKHSKQKTKKAWQFWKSGGGGDENPQGADDLVVPEEWLNAHINKGISSSDVENRRKRFGWNELTSEKTNLFKQFLSYFTGPVLYSKFCDLSRVLSN